MYDLVIIGGGIVGLATAYQISLLFPKKRILVLEKENSVGLHQTGHNSGVIHSGIYYKPGSLKANNCRNGISLLKKFCDDQKIKYEMCGKLIVATTKNEINTLNQLFNRGKENGILNLKIISKDQIKEYEPHAVGEKAIYCPETGIIDYSHVCDKLYELISKNGEVACGQKVNDIIIKNQNLIIRTGRSTFETKFIINCSGLFSDKIAQLAGLERSSRIIPFRGEYFMLKKSAQNLVRNLIYPVPNPIYPFLGVHFTRTIDGGIEAGPNAVLAFAREGYSKTSVNIKDMMDYLSYSGFWYMVKEYWLIGLKEYYRSVFKSVFLNSLQTLVPSITEDDIEESPSGVRAQALDAKGKLVDDFIIQKTSNMIHVLNAPSPAATSSFSIGNHISKMYSRSIN